MRRCVRSWHVDMMMQVNDWMAIPKESDWVALTSVHHCGFESWKLHPVRVPVVHAMCLLAETKEKKGKDYAFRRQFNEKPSIIPGCLLHAASKDAATQRAMPTRAYLVVCRPPA